MVLKAASEYPHGVNGIAFAVDQGAFTANDKMKDGGAFASPVGEGAILTLDTSAAKTVKVCGASDIPIGRASGEPFGPIEGQAISVNMFADKILDFEVDEASGAIDINSYLIPSANGTLKAAAEGQKSNFLALDACADPDGAGKPYKISVACGFYGEQFFYSHPADPVLFETGNAMGTGAEQAIAHGLGAIPSAVVLSDLLTGGALPKQTKAADITNIYVSATVDKDFVWVAYK